MLIFVKPKTESTERARERLRRSLRRLGESGLTGRTAVSPSLSHVGSAFRIRRFRRRDKPLNGLNLESRLFRHIDCLFDFIFREISLQLPFLWLRRSFGIFFLYVKENFRPWTRLWGLLKRKINDFRERETCEIRREFVIHILIVRLACGK